MLVRSFPRFRAPGLGMLAVGFSRIFVMEQTSCVAKNLQQQHVRAIPTPPKLSVTHALSAALCGEYVSCKPLRVVSGWPWRG